MFSHRLLWLSLLTLIPLIVSQDTPPPSCDEIDKKDNCLELNDCAWCTQGPKCTSWLVCKKEAKDCPKNETVITNEQSGGASEACREQIATNWIIIIVVVGIILCYLCAGIYGVYRFCKRRLGYSPV